MGLVSSWSMSPWTTWPLPSGVGVAHTLNGQGQCCPSCVPWTTVISLMVDCWLVTRTAHESRNLTDFLAVEHCCSVLTLILIDFYTNISLQKVGSNSPCLSSVDGLRNSLGLCVVTFFTLFCKIFQPIHLLRAQVISLLRTCLSRLLCYLVTTV